MDKQRLTEVVVRPRTLRLEYQTYPLANIARIQAGRLRIKKRLSSREISIGTAACLLVLSGLFGWASAGSPSRTALFMILTGLAALGGILVHRYDFGRREHVLSVEAAGGYSTQIFSKAGEQIKKLEQDLLDAIENPPSSAQPIPVGNNVYINKAKWVQVGTGNVQNA
jgi:hypothetical protein